MDIWDILGIAPTTDVRLIRKAYAELSKKHHPEDDPEMWGRISEAYRVATSYAKSSMPRAVENVIAIENAPSDDSSETDPLQVTDKKTSETEAATMPEDSWFDMDDEDPHVRDFDSIRDALDFAKALLASRSKRNIVSLWDELLSSQWVLDIRDDPYFLNRFAQVLRPWVDELQPKTRAVLHNYFQLSNYSNPADAGDYAVLMSILTNAHTRRADYTTKRGTHPWARLKERIGFFFT